VPTLLVERFAPPAGTRDARTRRYCREQMADELAGRTVWCTPRMREALEQLLRDRATVRSYSDEPVGRDDIVVLDDAPRAPAVRECGAHAVVRVRRLPDSPVSAVDAYVVAWNDAGTFACHLAAVMPHTGRVAQKDMGANGDDLAWGSLLADVAGADREERVGGRLHVRPAVAVR
jgi:hypothetical protein